MAKSITPIQAPAALTERQRVLDQLHAERRAAATRHEQHLAAIQDARQALRESEYARLLKGVEEAEAALRDHNRFEQSRESERRARLLSLQDPRIARLQERIAEEKQDTTHRLNDHLLGRVSLSERRIGRDGQVVVLSGRLDRLNHRILALQVCEREANRLFLLPDPSAEIARLGDLIGSHQEYDDHEQAEPT